MKILVLYQHIDSGAMVATEALLSCLKSSYPQHTYLIYRQETYRYSGPFSFLRNLWWSINDFKQKIQQARPDLIYTTVYTAIIAQELSSEKHTPSVFHLHGDHRFGEFKQRSWLFDTPRYLYALVLGQWILFLQRRAIQKSASTIFVSHFAKNEFITRYQLTHLHHRFHVIYNGVSLKDFSPVSDARKQYLKRKYHIPEKYVLTYIGRIDEKKGIHHLLHAANLITNKDICTLIIYPETKDEHSHQYLAQLQAIALDSPHRVQFVNNPRNISEYYQISDCVILPSEQEMFPLVMLESLASGVPFLCTAVGGVPEVLKELPYFLLGNMQHKNLAKRIQGILTLSKEHRQSLAKQERSLAQQYSWSKAATQLQHVFKITTQYQ